MSQVALSSPRRGCASERPLHRAGGRQADWLLALAAALLVHLSAALLLLQLQAPRAPAAGPERFLEVTLADLGRPSAAAGADAVPLRPAEPPSALATLPPAESVLPAEAAATDSMPLDPVAAEATPVDPAAVDAVAVDPVMTEPAAADALVVQAKQPAARGLPVPASKPSGTPGSSAPPEAGAEAGAGAAPGSAPTGAAAERAYLERLAAWLGRHRRYPRRARRLRQEGIALVRFRIDGRGRLLESSLEQSSGHALLDAEALDLLARAAPLPAPPRPVGLPLELVVPIRFALQ